MDRCVFCELKGSSLLCENELAKAFYDAYPVNEGHTLVVPKRHVATLFEAGADELAAINELIFRVRELLDEKYRPDGYNVGVNVGEAAGQSVFHLHYHVIPRYIGDVENPRGGIRKIKKSIVPHPLEDLREEHAGKKGRDAAAGALEGKMKTYRKELWFEVKTRRALINITDQVEACLRESGIKEGLLLCNAMHITSSVFINDDEPGLHRDFERFLEKLAPEKPYEQYEHNGFEDNADAHLKRTIVGREVVVAVTGGKLDFGPWEQIFYGEFDGKRRKRVLVKIIGV